MQRGFTLIEILVYIAIFLVLSTAAIATMLSFADSFARYRAEKFLTEQVRSSFEILLADVRNASAVDQVGSTLGTSPSTLVLGYAAEDRTYALTGGALTRTINAGTPAAITASPVTVSAFTATYFDMMTTELVRVSITASATVGDTTVTETYTSSAVLRGSYE